MIDQSSQDIVDELYMSKPCSGCPFLKTSMMGWLRKSRIEEICNSDSFPCHKTTQDLNKHRRQCAGHMLLVDKGSIFVRMAAAMSIKLKLTGRELVFDTVDDFIDHGD